ALKKVIPQDNEELVVDTKSGSVDSDKKNIAKATSDSYLPIPVYVRAASYDSHVKKIDDNLYQFDISCERPEDGAVEIAFDTAEDNLYYSAGVGEETIVKIPTDLKHDPAMTLSNGFLYLGNGYTIIKDCSVEHLAVTWRQKEKRAVFREELNENNPGMKMRFYVFKGPKEEGHKLANRLNTWPVFSVSKAGEKVELNKIFPIK
ncbi:MAG: hypothetical protein GXO85_15575, partial [Chlorobi bacterium]|nr:hypothetical protein [Chlorobiota bacterium]